jgi:hypothetical protein
MTINDDFLAKVNNDYKSDIKVAAIASWWIRYKGKTKPKLDDESRDDDKVKKNEARMDEEKMKTSEAKKNDKAKNETSDNGKGEENETGMDVETSDNGKGEENETDMDGETSHINDDSSDDKRVRMTKKTRLLTDSHFDQELLDVKVDYTAMSRALRSPSFYPILLT